MTDHPDTGPYADPAVNAFFTGKQPAPAEDRQEQQAGPYHDAAIDAFFTGQPQEVQEAEEAGPYTDPKVNAFFTGAQSQGTGAYTDAEVDAFFKGDDIKKSRIRTHDGAVHEDEYYATCNLKATDYTLSDVVRLREALGEHFDLTYDMGGLLLKEKGILDHHQADDIPCALHLVTENIDPDLHATMLAHSALYRRIDVSDRQGPLEAGKLYGMEGKPPVSAIAAAVIADFGHHQGVVPEEVGQLQLLVGQHWIDRVQAVAFDEPRYLNEADDFRLNDPTSKSRDRRNQKAASYKDPVRLVIQSEHVSEAELTALALLMNHHGKGISRFGSGEDGKPQMVVEVREATARELRDNRTIVLGGTQPGDMRLKTKRNFFDTDAQGNPLSVLEQAAQYMRLGGLMETTPAYRLQVDVEKLGLEAALEKAGLPMEAYKATIENPISQFMAEAVAHVEKLDPTLMSAFKMVGHSIRNQAMKRQKETTQIEELAQGYQEGRAPDNIHTSKEGIRYMVLTPEQARLSNAVIGELAAKLDVDVTVKETYKGYSFHRKDQATGKVNFSQVAGEDAFADKVGFAHPNGFFLSTVGTEGIDIEALIDAAAVRQVEASVETEKEEVVSSHEWDPSQPAAIMLYGSDQPALSEEPRSESWTPDMKGAIVPYAGGEEQEAEAVAYPPILASHDMPVLSADMMAALEEISVPHTVVDMTEFLEEGVNRDALYDVLTGASAQAPADDIVEGAWRFADEDVAAHHGAGYDASGPQSSSTETALATSPVVPSTQEGKESFLESPESRLGFAEWFVALMRASRANAEVSSWKVVDAPSLELSSAQR